MADYNVIRTDGTLLTTVADGTTDTGSASIIFVGRSLKDYAQNIAQNQFRILENFANTTEPAFPAAGQLWWDTSVDFLNVYDGNSFIPVALGADKVEVSGDIMTGPLILDADPIVPLGAATKQYVDAGAFTPAAGTDNEIVRYDGTTDFQSSGVFVNDFAQLIAIDGTAATPSITFSSDLALGFYRAGASIIGFAAGGLVQLTISTSTIDAQTNEITNIADPSDGAGVGDRAFNDARHTRSIVAGTGIDVADNLTATTTISHFDTSAVADTSNPPGTVIEDLTFDDFGHVTGANAVNLDNRFTRSISAGSGISVSGNLTATTTISHSSPTGQGSINNSGNTVIQDISLDTFGHITSMGSTTISSGTLINLIGTKNMGTIGPGTFNVRTGVENNDSTFRGGPILVKWIGTSLSVFLPSAGSFESGRIEYWESIQAFSTVPAGYTTGREITIRFIFFGTRLSTAAVSLQIFRPAV